MIDSILEIAISFLAGCLFYHWLLGHDMAKMRRHLDLLHVQISQLKINLEHQDRETKQ